MVCLDHPPGCWLLRSSKSSGGKPGQAKPPEGREEVRGSPELPLVSLVARRINHRVVEHH